MNRSLLFFLLAIPIVFFRPTTAVSQHFLKDEAYRQKVHEDFLKRKEMVKGRETELFSVFSKPGLTVEQKEALEFLYAYMPLCDLSEYDGEFFLNRVNGAFRARDFFSWGKNIPDDIFRHWVLAHRVNNEYLDNSRDVFFEELKDRVKGMTMEQAALEVNHWCHEKVTYRATDPRTSAPLALIMTSWGRCGEESTFTTDAMRAVGIPARQVYTPRWVHTDDNHAWVEVWVDGEWKYLGACEPEPELNVAWFSAPAKRMMMAHTTVMGPYEGPEERNRVTDYYSTINLLDNYSDTRTAEVLVTDAAGRSIENAEVRFKVYNYAELFTLAIVRTDAEGKASLHTGMGDVMVWAIAGDKFGFGKSSVGDETITVVVDSDPAIVKAEAYVIDVPEEQPIKGLTREQIARNAVRLAYEDSLRNAYMATFPDEVFARALAERTGLDPEQTWKFINMAQGNWREIEDFMTRNRENGRLFPFLSSLKDKDLRDTPASYLENHMNSGQVPADGISEQLFVEKVLSPRIHNELIQPWRSFLMNDEVASGLKTPQQILEYVSRNITIDNAQNYYACYLTPRGVHELGIADTRSRNIYFVALCRAAGIPSQIDQATGKPQYYMDGDWYDAVFSDTPVAELIPKGTVTLLEDDSNIVKPGYEKHFTLGYYTGGDYRTLDFRGNPVVKNFPMELTLDQGDYRLFVGSRANDGSVTVSTEYFRLNEGENYTATVTLPQVRDKIFVKGIIDMNTIVALDGGAKATLKELSKGKGLILCFADPDKEPTKHILQDLPAEREELEQWGGGVLFMVPDDKKSVSFDPTGFKGMPSQTVWGGDHERVLLDAAADALQIEFTDNFPLVVYLNRNGGILFSSEGYRIGIGENLLKTIRFEQQLEK